VEDLQDCSSKTQFVGDHPNDVIYQSCVKIVSEDIPCVSCFVYGTPSSNSCTFTYETIVSESPPEFARSIFSNSPTLSMWSLFSTTAPFRFRLSKNVFLPQLVPQRQCKKSYPFLPPPVENLREFSKFS
jgi:hypothetical protein